MSNVKIVQFPCTSERGKFMTHELDAPELGPHHLLLKSITCGVCHTDCVFMGKEGLVLGHEPIGRVIAKGSKVKRFNVGDIVGTSYLRKACMECRECTSGQEAMCQNRVMFPEGNLNGFATHQVCDSRFSYKIPDNMDPAVAAPLMCAGITVFSAIHSSKVPPTGRIAVIGIGGLGHLALQFARAWGCHVTAISGSPSKKEEALSFGAHDFLCSKEFTPEHVAKLEKYDLILDTVSQNIDFDLYFGLLARNASFYLIGIPEGPVVFHNPMHLLLNQISVKGSIVGGRYLIDLMLEFAQRHNIKPKIEEYPYDLKGLEEAIARCDVSATRYRAVLVAKE